MSLEAFDDFIDECYVRKDPICNLYIDDSLWLDKIASELISNRDLPLKRNDREE